MAGGNPLVAARQADVELGAGAAAPRGHLVDGERFPHQVDAAEAAQDRDQTIGREVVDLDVECSLFGKAVPAGLAAQQEIAHEPADQTGAPACGANGLGERPDRGIEPIETAQIDRISFHRRRV
jgi:hypothetical protein